MKFTIKMGSAYNLYMPVADLTSDPVVLILIGLFAGFVSGICGIGGGMVSIPILISIGIPITVAMSTSATQLIASSSSALMFRLGKGKVDYKFAIIMLFGGVVSSLFGTRLLYYMNEVNIADNYVSIGLLCLLIFISVFSLFETTVMVYHRYYKLIAKPRVMARWVSRVGFFKLRVISLKDDISMLLPLGMGVINGIAISTLGVGGSVLLMPVFLYIICMQPSHALTLIHFQTMMLSIAGCFLHSMHSNSPDLFLSFAVIIGAVIGSQIGSRISVKMNNESFKVVVTVIMMILSIRLGIELFGKPENLYTMKLIL
ncbi:putative anion permease [Candidatus Cyrtobacter comes]|uniref:Probable membrane transporter protein n=1 Tax=Candidatus Cyrtobacter comes TaxID=675776 RepID=A0ABU5L965_9RICK|nr:putative anion permease [Candidatus Cyrtobacter comes]